MSRVFESQNIFVEIHESEIPWLKIFTQKPYKEFSECDGATKNELFVALELIEKEMIHFYNPTKINIASFGNYLPHVHFHIMARFLDDSYFPEPMWGVKQREGTKKLENMDVFLDKVSLRLKQSMIKH